MILFLKARKQLTRLESIEVKHSVCKSLAMKGIAAMLAEYIDEKFVAIDEKDVLNLETASYFDYMMLPLYDESEKFTLNAFLSAWFSGKQMEHKFKELLNKITIYEDVAEIIILLKRLDEQLRATGSLFSSKLQVCVFYFRQMNQLKCLHRQLIELTLVEFEAKIKQTTFAKASTESAKTSEVVRMQQRCDSKVNLLSSINMLQKEATALVY